MSNANAYRGEAVLLPGERIDDLQRNGYGIIQKDGAFRFGMDAVLLSGFARVRRGETAADIGTGTGIIPLLLAAKTEGRYFYGVEIQPEMAQMAERSVRLNALEDRIGIVTGDIRELAREFAGGRVDVVTCNPPYMKASHGLINPDPGLAAARHELSLTLEECCRAAAQLLRDGGRFYMVHRPFRLPEIISALKAFKLEPKRLKPVYPYADKEATMILIEAVRGGGEGCRLEKPLIIYREEGVYTDEIYEIYGY